MHGKETPLGSISYHNKARSVVNANDEADSSAKQLYDLLHELAGTSAIGAIPHNKENKGGGHMEFMNEDLCNPLHASMQQEVVKGSGEVPRTNVEEQGEGSGPHVQRATVLEEENYSVVQNREKVVCVVAATTDMVTEDERG